MSELFVGSVFVSLQGFGLHSVACMWDLWLKCLYWALENIKRKICTNKWIHCSGARVRQTGSKNRKYRDKEREREMNNE